MASSAFRYFKPLKTTYSHFALELKIASLLQKDIDFDNPESKTKALIQTKDIVADYMAGFNGFQKQYTLYAIWIESLNHGGVLFPGSKKMV